MSLIDASQGPALSAVALSAQGAPLMALLADAPTRTHTNFGSLPYWRHYTRNAVNRWLGYLHRSKICHIDRGYMPTCLCRLVNGDLVMESPIPNKF